jgi:hypothetical protein
MKYRKRVKTNPLNIRFKENTIANDLAEYLRSTHDIDLVLNKKIEGGGSKRRPDALIDRGNYCIIVEIDERQHRSSQYSKDGDDRMTDILSDLKGRQLVLIRFNPDSYKSGGIKYRSLFCKSRGDRLYKIGCPNKYQARMNTLKSLIDYHIMTSPSQPFIEHKLFFDKKNTNHSLGVIQFDGGNSLGWNNRDG